MVFVFWANSFFSPVSTNSRPMWKSLLFGIHEDKSGHIGLLFLRIFAGLAMAFSHGLKKIPPSEKFIASVSGLGFPAPDFFAWAAGLSELVGGIFIAIGLFTRPSAFFLTITMFVAAFMRHGDEAFGAQEKALLYAVLAILLIIQGPGKYSFDWMIDKKLHSKASK